jgi:hypothetical protein
VLAWVLSTKPACWAGRGHGAGNLAVGVGHALEGDRGEQDGVGEAAPEEAHPGVPAGQRAQHARVEAHGIPGAGVGGKV